MSELTPNQAHAIVRRAASKIARNMIEVARAAPLDEPVQFVTGNSYMPPLRSYEQAEDVWQYDHDESDPWMWERLVDDLDSRLAQASVLLDAPDYDNALYVVDLGRFEHVEDADGDSLNDEWKVIEP